MKSLGCHLFDVLSQRPERVVATFIGSGGEATNLRAGELVASAQRIGAALAAMPLTRRSLVGISHKSGAMLHAAWLGTILADHVPTMVAPPSPRMEPRKYAEGFRSILHHLGVKVIVVDAATRVELGDLLPEGLQVVVTGPDLPPAMAAVTPLPVELADEVLVQHTSGTTGVQKAIGFTSRQIIAHTEAYARCLKLRADDVVVSWLPLYHDMGLIACLVTPLLTGTRIVEISPFDWVQSPTLLFDAIERHCGTFCWLPNFAFRVLSEERVLAQAVACGKTWNLSSMRAFISCSEPVLAGAIERFVARLAPYGVRREMVIASYAMAENLFAVSQNPLGRPREEHFVRTILEIEGRAVLAGSRSGDAVTLVSNGRPLPTTRVEVRDSGGRILPEDSVGQLCVQGTHVFSGYRQSPELSAEVMDSGGCYATGDLGFINRGEVFVTGRLKDLIIIRGRNYYPHDIETVVGEVPGVNPGRVAAFGVPDDVTGTEKLVIMLELLDGQEAAKSRVVLAVRRAVVQSLDCTVGELLIVAPRTLVKSTSGKVARADNRRRYLESKSAG